MFLVGGIVMKNVVFVTFIGLGLSFYQMSGGADFEPVERARAAVAAPVVEVTKIDPVPGLAVDGFVIPPTTEQIAQHTSVVLASLENLTPETTLLPVPAPQATPAAVLEIPQPEPDPSLDIRVVVGSSVNMRLGPGTGYNKVAALTGGTEVVALEDSNGWTRLKVVDTGRVGWMATRFLTEL